MGRMVTRGVVTWSLCLILVAGPGRLATPPARAEPPPAIQGRDYEVLEVYLSVEQALRLVFPTSERIVSEEVRLTEAQAERVASLADHPLWEEGFTPPHGSPALQYGEEGESPKPQAVARGAGFTVYKGLTQERVDGYAIVTEEIGRFHAITFLVGVSAEGRVRRVDVLIYRESRGGEVRHRRFLRQFEGKGVRDPIRLNRDLLNITGATLSVRAMSRGVRKVLGVIREAYGVPS